MVGPTGLLFPNNAGAECPRPVFVSDETKLL
jgi:hypothetical protein